MAGKGCALDSSHRFMREIVSAIANEMMMMMMVKKYLTGLTSELSMVGAKVDGRIEGWKWMEKDIEKDIASEDEIWNDIKFSQR